MCSSDSGFDSVFRNNSQAAGTSRRKKRSRRNTASDEPESDSSQTLTTTEPMFTKRQPKFQLKGRNPHLKQQVGGASGSGSSSTRSQPEILVLSSDSDDDDDHDLELRSPRLRQRSLPPHPPPAADMDKVEAAIVEILKVVGTTTTSSSSTLNPEKVLLAYKKMGQRVDETIEYLLQKKHQVGGGDGGGRKEGKGKVDEERKEKKKKQKQAQIALDLDPEEEEEEIDELESDPESDGEAEEGYWLNVEKRSEAWNDLELQQTYEKAARVQLYADWSQVPQTVIDKVFKEFQELYAPTWLELNRLRKSQGFKLVKLKKARDIEWKHVVNKETKKVEKVKRDEGPKSRKLDLEMDWLSKYVKNNLRKKDKAKDKDMDVKGKGKVADSSPKKQKQRTAPLYPGKKAVGNSKNFASSSKSTASSSDKGKAKAKPYCPDDDEFSDDQEEEGGGGWGIGGGALATANHYGSSSSSKKRKQRPDRYSVFHDGKKVDRNNREGTVAFSGQGRTLG